MTKISDFTALAGAGVDQAADVVPIVDMSEAGAVRNKKISVAELLGLAFSAEAIDDRVAALLTAGSNITLTYDDVANTLTIAATTSSSGISDFNEAVDDRVAALIDPGAGISVTYDDVAGTLVIANVGAGASYATAAEIRTGTEASKAIAPDQLFAAAVSVALADGATITPDFATGINFHVALAGNRTLANPTNVKAGQSGRIRVAQDATGSRTLSFGANWLFAGGDPTLSTAANAIDVIAYYCHSATEIEASIVKALA